MNYTINKLRLGNSTRLFRGVTMQNCYGAEVGNNTVEWQSGMTDPDEINLYADQVQGIRADEVTGSTLHNNTVTTCGTGIHVENDCSGSYLTCNQLNDNYPGMNLVYVTLPDQGDACIPTANVWNIASGEDKVEPNSYTSTGSPFNYYYGGATNNNNPEYPIPPLLLNVINAIPISTCQPSDPCDGGGSHQLMSEDPEKKDEELSNLVDDPEEPEEEDEFTNETEYKKQEYVYRVMQGSPDLINTGNREDFMDSTEENNIGKLEEVKALMLDNNTEQAVIKNNLIVDTNQIETNKKTVNGIYLSSPDTLAPADSATLDQIAHLPARQGGEAVYWTRGKLKYYIEDNYVSSQRRAHRSEKQKVHFDKLISVFPNPASSELNVNGLPGECDIEIYDALGKLVFDRLISQKDYIINIADLVNGLYYMKVCNSRGFYKTTFAILK